VIGQADMSRQEGSSIGKLRNNTDSSPALFSKIILNSGDEKMNVFLFENDSYHGDSWMVPDNWNRILNANQSNIFGNDLGIRKISFLGGQPNEVVVPLNLKNNRVTALYSLIASNYLVLRYSEVKKESLTIDDIHVNVFNQIRSEINDMISKNREEKIGLQRIIISQSYSPNQESWNLILLRIKNPNLWANFIDDNLEVILKNSDFRVTTNLKQQTNLTRIVEKLEYSEKMALIRLTFKKAIIPGYYYIHFVPTNPTNQCYFEVSDRIIWPHNRQFTFSSDKNLIRLIKSCPFEFRVNYQ
jgi:hypothetical protein